MARLAVARAGDLKIPNGAAVSNAFLYREVFEDAEEINLMAPAVLDAFTFTIEVTDVEGGTYRTLQDGSPPADVNPPAAGKARAYTSGLLSCVAFRLRSSSNVAADRIWAATKQFRVT